MIEEIEIRLKAATKEIKGLEKERKMASKKTFLTSLAQHYQNLVELATEKQMDIILEIADLQVKNIITEKQAAAIVKRATK